jgi:hypothetical protein
MMAALVLATNAGYVATGWTIVVVVLATYSMRLAIRGRRLARLVPPARRRWADADTELPRTRVGESTAGEPR